MKKFYANYTEEKHKDEIIVYASSKSEAYKLVEDYANKIDDDYTTEVIKIFNWPPKEEFDEDNTLIIRKDKIIEPNLQPFLTPKGEILYKLIPESWSTDLINLGLSETKKLRKDILALIESRIKNRSK